MMERSFATIGKAKANSRLTAYKKQAAMYERMRKQNEKDNDAYAKFLDGTGFKDLQGVSGEVNEAIKSAYNNNRLKFDEFKLLNTEKRQQNKDDITNLATNIQVLQSAVSLDPNTINPHADTEVVNLLQLLKDKAEGKDADLKISGAQDNMDLMFTYGTDDPKTPENERRTMSLADFREKVGTYRDITEEVKLLEDGYSEEKSDIIKTITAEARLGQDNSLTAISAGIESFMKNDGYVKGMYDYNISPFSGPVRINNKGELDATSKEALNVPMRYDHRSNARIKELNPDIKDEEIDIIRNYQRDQVQNVISKRLNDELTDITLKIKENNSGNPTLRMDERFSFTGIDKKIRKGITEINVKEYDDREDKARDVVKLLDKYKMGGKNLQKVFRTKSEIFEQWKDAFKEQAADLTSEQALEYGIAYKSWWDRTFGGATKKTGKELEDAWEDFFKLAGAQEAFNRDVGDGDIYLYDTTLKTFTASTLDVDDINTTYQFILDEQSITSANKLYFQDQFLYGSEEYRSGN